MDASGALQPALGGRRVEAVEAASAVAPDLPAVVPGLESERLFEKGVAGVGVAGVGAGAVEAPQRHLRWNLGVLGDQRVVIGAADAKLVAETLRIGKAQSVSLSLGLDALSAQPLGPEVERLRRRDPPGDRVDHPVAGAAWRGAGVLEEGQVGTGVALLVGEEEVVDGRIVLVDRLLHQPQAQHAGIEVDVLLGFAGDRSDVVDALELHACILPYLSAVLSASPRSG